VATDRIASIAADLSDHLTKVRESIEATGELQNNRFARAISLVCTVVQAAIESPKIEDLAKHIELFGTRKGKEEIESN
jgi:hypothetical protein